MAVASGATVTAGIRFVIIVRSRANNNSAQFQTGSLRRRFEILSPELNWHKSNVSRETF